MSLLGLSLQGDASCRHRECRSPAIRPERRLLRTVLLLASMMISPLVCRAPGLRQTLWMGMAGDPWLAGLNSRQRKIVFSCAPVSHHDLRGNIGSTMHFFPRSFLAQSSERWAA